MRNQFAQVRKELILSLSFVTGVGVSSLSAEVLTNLSVWTCALSNALLK